MQRVLSFFQSYAEDVDSLSYEGDFVPFLVYVYLILV
jgi:hypothetical protein